MSQTEHDFVEFVDDGLLWLVNRVVFHPRGLSLAFHIKQGGQATGWSLSANDNSEPFAFDPETDDEGFNRVEQLIREVRAKHGEGSGATPGS